MLPRAVSLGPRRPLRLGHDAEMNACIDLGRRFVCAILTVVVAFWASEARPDEKRDVESVYDDSYAAVYDLLWMESDKYKWEVDQITATIRTPQSEVRILDSGCGTGTHYSYLAKSYEVVGLDISDAMVRVAKQKNPGGQFVVGDMKNRSLFDQASFSHIISMYEATFYNRELGTILGNYSHWLRDDGILVLETIDPEKLTDRVRSDNPPRYRQQTEKLTKVAWWKLPEKDGVVIYHEELRFNNGQEVVKEHLLYLPRLSDLEDLASKQGFRLTGKKPSPFFPEEVLYVFAKRTQP
jgi:SAM-dependent methyltransferase